MYHLEQRKAICGAGARLVGMWGHLDLRKAVKNHFVRSWR